MVLAGREFCLGAKCISYNLQASSCRKTGQRKHVYVAALDPEKCIQHRQLNQSPPGFYHISYKISSLKL
ncbi:hypothetical protein Y1Q_0008608 [Alligator mississippiensis]|uniref:Uncharacterized protein n=1 Tax=Alligator mississippiensis TaxID=8496 RepID=A0A151N9E5_ALLMI|nr:hypothetical protein Y1Q_0008608 [Alligator mississippiensis]